MSWGNDALETTVVCQGCENECEVGVAFRDGSLVCLGGNKCPTGESFALAQASRELADNRRIK